MGALNHREAAEYLGIAPQTLYNWRHKRKGPNYVKMGSKIVYRLDDLEHYIASNKIKLEDK